MSTAKTIQVKGVGASGVAVMDLPPQTEPRFPESLGSSGAPAEQAAGAAIWLRGKQFTGLWCNSQDGVAWVAVAGVGWRKLSNSSPIANISLCLLATQALQTGRAVDYREEADKMIHEIYVW